MVYKYIEYIFSLPSAVLLRAEKNKDFAASAFLTKLPQLPI